MLYFFVSICYIFCATTYGSSQDKLNLADVFDTGIYNQSGPLVQNESRVDRLCRLKEKQYTARRIKPVDDVIQIYTDLLSEGEDGVDKFNRNMRKLIDKAEKDHSEYREMQTSWRGRAAGFTGALPGFGPSIVRFFGMPDIADIGEKAKASQQKVDNEHRIRAPQGLNKDQLTEKIRTFQAHRNRLIEALKHDELAGLEAYYVEKKPSYSCERLKEDIEFTFIAAYNDPNRGRDYREFIERFLLIPTVHRTINTKDDALYSLFSAHPEFPNYPIVVQKNLFRIILGVAYDSRRDLTTDLNFPLRKTAYFYGAPGCGKTTAAYKIPEFLGLPCFNVSVRTLNDLSNASLEGEHRRSLGWLADALIKSVRSNAQDNNAVPEEPNANNCLQNIKWATKRADAERVKNHKTYLNGFLVINDFDRILLDPRTETSALAFLLEYLDTDKRTFKSQYFDTQLDISRLNIIITGNHQIPSDGDPNDPTSNYVKYHALRQRLDIIRFV